MYCIVLRPTLLSMLDVVIFTVLLPTALTLQVRVAVFPSIAVTFPESGRMNSGWLNSGRAWVW